MKGVTADALAADTAAVPEAHAASAEGDSLLVPSAESFAMLQRASLALKTQLCSKGATQSAGVAPEGLGPGCKLLSLR